VFFCFSLNYFVVVVFLFAFIVLRSVCFVLSQEFGWKEPPT